MKEIQELIKRVEVEINKTPTGELRNLLCDTNIVLQQQALNIAAVSGAKRKVCPVCKKTFEKGWGEFCSQDCWDTDM